jgi:hypothetical protein
MRKYRSLMPGQMASINRLAQRLAQEAAADRQPFSQQLHDRIVRSVAEHTSTRPVDHTVRLDATESHNGSVPHRRTARYGLSAVAATLCLALIALWSQWPPQSTTSEPVQHTTQLTSVAAAQSEQGSGGAWIELLDVAADELTWLLTVTSTKRWASAEHDLALATDGFLETFPFGTRDTPSD